jgi:Caspase domain
MGLLSSWLGLMMRIIAVCTCAVMLMFLGTLQAQADKRVALVIGNGAYQNTAFLTNPANDADDMAAALQSVGFEVIIERNVNKRSLEIAMARFARVAQDADSALFYYAGHGMQYRGVNYLMPIDARLEDEFSVNYELTRIDDVLFAMSGARGVKILILDSCRDNPLADRLSRRATNRDIVAMRGLARIEAARGMIIAYATQSNQVAVDGTGRNSPFTGALLKEIEQPGLEIATLFRRVAANVERATGGRQLPELSISMSGEFYLNTQETDVRAWVRVRESSSITDLQEFMRQYPQSFLTADARARIAALEREQITQEVAERQRREQAEREKIEREHADREQAVAKPVGNNAIAVLTPPPEVQAPVATAALSGSALILEIKKELTRVGCYAGHLDDKWATIDTKSSIQKFLRFARLPTAPNEPTIDFLDAIRGRSERVCPLECGARQVEAIGRCVTKACPGGHRLSDDGTCIVVAMPKSAQHASQAHGSGRRCFALNGRSFCE